MITRIAAQELVLEGKANWHPATLAKKAGQLPLILLDGCDRKCLSRSFAKNDDPDVHRLALTDVGIEPSETEDITRDDIELAKDAVIAECTDVSDLHTPLFPGCGCR